jgi:PadR family transcriptional regulator PadR
VFKVLLDNPAGRHYGLEVGKAAGLPSGSIYPLLMRLEQAGWLTSDWEDVDPKAAGRPRRRLYQLTGQGAEIGRRALAEAQRDLAPGWGRAPRFPLPGGASA